MRIQKLILVLIAFSPLTTLHAAWLMSSAFKINAIRTYYNGSFELVPEGAPLGNCNFFAFHLGQGGNPLNTDGAKASLALALSAKSQNLPVSVLYDDNDYVGYCYSQQIYFD